jgi:hypothetical protein
MAVQSWTWHALESRRGAPSQHDVEAETQDKTECSGLIRAVQPLPRGKEALPPAARHPLDFELYDPLHHPGQIIV